MMVLRVWTGNASILWHILSRFPLIPTPVFWGVHCNLSFSFQVPHNDLLGLLSKDSHPATHHLAPVALWKCSKTPWPPQHYVSQACITASYRGHCKILLALIWKFSFLAFLFACFTNGQLSCHPSLMRYLL